MKNHTFTLGIEEEFAIIDPETRELRIAAAHGLTRAEIARGIYRIGEGVVGRVVSSGKAMIVPNVGEEPPQILAPRDFREPQQVERGFGGAGHPDRP